MKKQCLNCNKMLGLFNFKTLIEDGVLCNDCVERMKKVGMRDIEDRFKFLKYNKIKEIYENKKLLAEKFEKDFQLGTILIKDHTNKLLVIDGILLEFKNLSAVETKFQYEESTTTNSTSKTKKGIGRSLVGGMLFGGMGALVGGMTAGKKTKSQERTTTSTICTSAKLILTFNDYYIPKFYVDLGNYRDEIKSCGCDSIEEFGGLIEAELNEIIQKPQKGEK